MKADAGSVPSSGSVAVADSGTSVPIRNLAGTFRSTSGALLPTLMSSCASSLAPSGSVTVIRTVNVPLRVYVWLGFAVLAVGVPSPKSHSKSMSSRSGSVESAPRKATASGAGPSSGVADATAVGARLDVVGLISMMRPNSM